MNTSRVEDERKARADNIRKQMRQQWIPKSTKKNSSNGNHVTQGMGDTITSN